MPRVKTTTARKDYPAQGIKKGDTYYSWSFFRGPTMRSKTYPRTSQLTQSAWSDIHSAYEVAQDLIEERYNEWTCTHQDDRPWDVDRAKSIINELESAVDDIVSVADDACSEKRDIADEHFGGEGPHAEQAEAMEEASSLAQDAASELSNIDLEEITVEGVLDWESLFESLQQIVANADPSNCVI